MKRVMFAISHLKIKTSQHLLAEQGIESFTLDTMDSAHGGLFGDIQLYVDEAHAVQARKILEEEGMI